MNMISELNLYQFEDQPIRLQQDETGQTWFNANDICAVLGFANPRQALSDNVDEDDVRRTDIIDSMGRTQQANYINESALYALILGSRLPTAKAFKRWVTSEVLPTVRKTGSYRVPASASSTLTRAEAMLLNARVRMHTATLRTIDDIHKLTPLADEALSAVKAAVTETTLGKLLPALKPQTSTEWFTPTQIAERLSITANRVGLIVSELGIRGNIDGICRAVLNKASHSDRTVTTYQYSEKAIAQISEMVPAQRPSDAILS